ncbi:MAG: AAA family ATPase [Cyanomargarita calcarea GSE-NOS-MK-12-04C]|uniref:histidine kinase n=1 Tax=Cyanomargarita calcarea GSE-NOS-MK-12-04C TaxID=2839659 RepID=A0A951USJ2_9CYAN|nr:AAA family ATPase [Cyanomargarita calcarea GSE-NOS-MK-12-04C]
MKLSGYQFLDQIYSGTKTLVYRGIKESDDEPVVIKLLRHEYPTFSELVQFRNQYSIAKNIDLPGVIKTYSLEPYHNSYALVMEDFGGISLKECQVGKNPNFFDEFFHIAIQIITTLEGLYRNRVIHKDIKPANILINPITKQIKLIDFSIASLLPRETQTLRYPNVLEGTLAYISPEQTGRMNRGIDWRSDFYSLGITLFELLTGQLPFTSDDAMELVYCHIAKQPPSVHSINPDIPLILSDIIAKLMAKNAEDRYQSALGLKYDLEACWQTYQKIGKFESFELGSRDISDCFAIPEKLYGRETEVKTLLAAFDRVAAGNREMMLVAGFSGIGKTAVVNEVHKPIVRQRGYFIKGKYDQFQRNIPLAAFVQAFRDLMEQLLSESNAQLQEWRNQILAALGEQGQVIIEVIPELEKIIGKQPPVAEISGSAVTNRFNLLFQKFIQVFTAKKHPLVIFIDDLQWADLASLKLIELLMCESNTQHLLLIGAYRDNEVLLAHPLMLTLEEIRKNQAQVNIITLNALSTTNLNNLLSDTLKCSLEVAFPLALLVHQKTSGNPFFSNQFIRSLYEDGLIIFNFEQYYWQCELSTLKQLALSTDVVEFMAIQLKKLPISTQEVLKFGACIGNQFDLATLAIVNNKSQSETASELWKALQEGLLIPANEVYKFFQDESSNNSPKNDTQVKINYKFLHDRVQQAAYSLIPEVQKKSTHLKIGQLLLKNTPTAKQEERIFDIVNQLNYGVELINTQEELDKLAHLNLIAGRKAKSSTAYTAAMKHFSLGLEILGVDSWHQYSLCLALHEEACDAAYLCGDFEEMDRFAEKVINFGATLLDKVRVYEIKIQACIVQNKLIEALTIAFNVLKLIDIKFPEAPTKSDIQQAFQATAEQLTNKKIADLINLPEMTDLKILAAMRILSSTFSAAYLGCPEFVPLITLKLVDLSIQYGNTGLSANGYCTYGFLLCSVVGNIDVGYEFAQLSLNVLSKTNATSLQAQTLLLYNSLVGHWKNHARNFLRPLQEVYQIGLQTGDLEFAAYALHNYSFGCYLTGKELTGLEREMGTYCETLKLLKQKTGLGYVQIWQQTVLNLMNPSQDVCCLIGKVYDEQVMLPIHEAMNDITAIGMVYFNKFTLNYLVGNLPLALEYSVEVEKYLPALTGLLIYPAFYFYDSLVKLAVYFEVTSPEQNQILEKVNYNQEKMKHWANHAPMNFLHKYYLVEAEQQRILGEKVVAMDYYDKAIALAKQNEYLQEEALANELAAKFYLEWGKETIAQTYLINAYYCYARWGALAKVNDLEKRYPQLVAPIQQREKVYLNTQETISISSRTDQTITSSTIISESLDLISFVKASQTISSEIQIDKLLINLMQVLIENAGASKGVLMMPNKSEWVIEAIGLAAKTITTVLQSIPVEESQDIPINLINYVSRTQEYVMFNDDAVADIDNFNDPYILEQQPKSLLCNPILNQGKLIAILYLENNLTVGAFTDDRLLVLNLLCSQAAISLENARLYQQSQDYSQQLERSFEDLKHAQLQLIQNEKMSALGNLVSGIGHEINNPIGSLVGNLQPAREYVQDLFKLIDLYKKYYPNPVVEIAKEIKAIDLDYVQDDLPKLISSMHQAADRICDMSISLRTFSRADTDKKIPFNIHEGIDSTLMILKHRLKASEIRPEIEVMKNYDDLPEIHCFPGQLNQVFMNLLANGIDALDESNTGRSFGEIEASPNRITITTKINNNKKQVAISIQDNGVGMSEEVRARIFDHLFTTKPVGKGTGLGLAIAYQIVVEKHGGTIEVNSVPGQGASFVISIPLE